MSFDNLIQVSFPNHFSNAATSLPTEDDMRAAIRGETAPRKRAAREYCSGMYFYPRLNLWKSPGGNLKFDPKDMHATSYDWWSMLKRINGKLVFNSYRYSVSTAKHQSAVRGWLSANKIAVDLYIESPKGLQRLDSAIDCHMGYISRFESEIARPRSNKRKNEERCAAIKIHKAKIASIKKLMKGINQ